MAIIRSFGTVQTLAAPAPTWNTTSHAGGRGLYPFNQTYATLYRTQPNIRTVVDFLARNVAQLGLHAFRRVSDTDRVRLAKHDVIRWLGRPNPATSRYRMFEDTMKDLGIYLNAFWLKIRIPPERNRPKTLGLVRLPPHQVEVEGGLFPRSFTWTLDTGDRREFPPTEIVHFGGYDPENPLTGLSPLETLRRILAEDVAASDYRQYFWRNAARHEGVIERPKDAPKWKPEQRKAFREAWQEAHSGVANSGKTAILEDGMQWKDRSYSAKESELTLARKLTREECAAAYHVPLPMVGILDHATFSNIKEQHKHLYADTLGPWNVMIEEEIERQLLPEADDTEDVYFEFNISEKLKGSFEEQADGIMKLTGRPVLTANEARARLNLSRITNDPSADQLAMQLNTTTPGSSSSLPARREPDVDEGAIAAVVEQHRRRQFARLEKLEPEDRPHAFNLTRYNAELTADLEALGLSAERARGIAETMNAATLAELTEAV